MEPDLIAAEAMLDGIYLEKLPAVDGDSSSYTFGMIGKHNVVVAYLPSRTYGNSPAAWSASQMSRSFRCLRVSLLVGIGGGVPRLTGDDAADFLLGDLVVSDPIAHTGGVIQCDLGKTNKGELRPERTGDKHEGRGNRCDECSKSRSVVGPRRQSSHPDNHYRTIASGNQGVKDSVTRDYWGTRRAFYALKSKLLV